MTSASPLVAGVDGAPIGWVAAIGSVEGDRFWLTAVRALEDLVELHPSVRHWAVDIPIGLAEDGPRESDKLARDQLGPQRAASVFSAPVRPAVGASTYREACSRSAAVRGKMISKQAWNIVPKINETRSLLITRPQLQRRMFETHPELCFQRLASGEALADPKKSPTGQRRRRRLLADHFGAETVERVIGQAAATRGVGIDDALDAMACWTAAARAAVGELDWLPGKPRRDADGLSMAIGY